MAETDIKKVEYQNKILRRIILAVIILLCLYAVERTAAYLGVQDAQQHPPLNFSGNICDDADKTALDYSASNPPSIEVPLREHCFSGYLFLPKAWQSWQVQFKGADRSDWEAHWWGGSPNYHGPFSYDQIMARLHTDENVPSMSLRLQGKGILRFIRVLSVPGAIPDEEASRKSSDKSSSPDVRPFLPRSGPVVVQRDIGVLNIQFWNCHRVAEQTECYGTVNNEDSMQVQFEFSIPEITDDMGNQYRVTALAAQVDSGACPNNACYMVILPKSSETVIFRVDGIVQTSPTVTAHILIKPDSSGNGGREASVTIPIAEARKLTEKAPQ